MFFLLLIKMARKTVIVITNNITIPPKPAESERTKLSCNFFVIPVNKNIHTYVCVDFQYMYIRMYMYCNYIQYFVLQKLTTAL